LACLEGSEDDGDGSLQNVLVVSYTRKTLGQTGTGHFSPIAAYDTVSDSLLILDTARFKYGAHWVALPLMFQAMQPIDPDTGRSRGYVLLTKNEDDQHHALPLSVLFQTKMKQNSVRRDFKQYVAELDHEVTWDEIVKYWTNDGTSVVRIWQMIEAKWKPDEDEKEVIEMVNQVLSLLRDLVPTTDSPMPARDCVCRPNYGRTLDILPQHVMFIVYLACLDTDRRYEIIFDEQKSSASSLARQQLLAEAELVHYAIEMSDQSANF
jgi:Phytochelatin synthase